jgi:long-chain acyl-CoA synthetase
LKTTLCCPVLQGYGLTETCAATTVMDLDDNSLGILQSTLNIFYMQLCQRFMSRCVS